MKHAMIGFSLFILCLVASVSHTQASADTDQEYSLDRGPSEAVAIFAQVERWQRAHPSSDHVYVISAEGIQCCFSMGTDEHPIDGCKAMVAKAEWNQFKGLKDIGPKYEREYLRLKAIAEYCGICGPTGR